MSEDRHVTILPAQVVMLSRMAFASGGAVGISQRGSVLTYDNGREKVTVDAQGRLLPYNKNQERLC